PLGNVGNIKPVARHIVRSGFFDLAHFHDVDFTKLGEVDRWHARYTTSTTHGCTGLSCGNNRFDISPHIVFEQPTAWTGTGNFIQIYTQLTREPTHRWTSVDVTGLNHFFFGSNRR